MGCRAQIIVRDAYEALWFYRHEGHLASTRRFLQRFLDLVKDGRARANASQASGWLIVMGRTELRASDRIVSAAVGYAPSVLGDEPTGGLTGWKASEVEPCAACLHLDTEYLWTIDLVKLRLTYITGARLERLRNAPKASA